MSVHAFLIRQLAALLDPPIQFLRQWTKPNRTSLARGAIADLSRSRAKLMMENALLGQQLIVLERQVKRPKLTWRVRSSMVLLSSWLAAWQQALLIVQPDTVLRWQRDLFRLVWRGKSRTQARVGRLPVSTEKIGLIRRLARENQLWGAERIRGELLKLGMGVARSTVPK